MKRISTARKPVSRAIAPLSLRMPFMKPVSAAGLPASVFPVLRTIPIRPVLLSFLLAAGLTVPAHAQVQSGGPWTVTSFTTGSGGGRSTGGVWTATGTSGQADASPGTAAGGAFAVAGGFWADAVVIPVETDGPQLTIAPLNSTGIQLNWPDEATGFTLQRSTDLINWTDIQVISRGAGSSTLSLRQGSRFFFRLIQK